MRRFKLVRVMMGSGWPSGHVAIDWYHSWPDKPGGGEMCLTTDTQDANELSHEIDELIAELEVTRLEAPRRFAQWKSEYETTQQKKRKRRCD